MLLQEVKSVENFDSHFERKDDKIKGNYCHVCASIADPALWNGLLVQQERNLERSLVVLLSDEPVADR
jgi:hypothetical protein